MTILAKGVYRAVEISAPGDLDRAMALRARAFPADRAGGDGHDALFRHVLVEDLRGGEAVATFRLMVLGGGADLARSYTAGFYDLAPLSRRAAGPMVELGRFCVRDGRRDADILRLAWAALTRIVDKCGAEMLFGCASFPGTDPAEHGEAFALLSERHLAPDPWRPRARAARTVPLRQLPGGRPDSRRALAGMPPLLRSYLAMGGQVSDHAVIDAAMGTLHVFTGVEVRAIPASRRRALREVAG